jgi:hypothetical protein
MWELEQMLSYITLDVVFGIVLMVHGEGMSSFGCWVVMKSMCGLFQNKWGYFQIRDMLTYFGGFLALLVRLILQRGLGYVNIVLLSEFSRWNMQQVNEATFFHMDIANILRNEPFDVVKRS